jgi:hypothetical protein
MRETSRLAPLHALIKANQWPRNPRSQVAFKLSLAINQNGLKVASEDRSRLPGTYLADPLIPLYESRTIHPLADAGFRPRRISWREVLWIIIAVQAV